MVLGVAATPQERAAARPGDDLVPGAQVVMDRAFDVAAAPAEVFPWLEQLGKGRAGWYLPRLVERVIPRDRRALRHVDPRWLGLRPGDVIPDYGGAHETFTVADVRRPEWLVHTSQRGGALVSWTLHLTPTDTGQDTDRDVGTRVHLRLRVGPVKDRWLVASVGEGFDLLTVAGMAAGLRERVGRVAGAS